MKIVSAAEMREIDRITTEKFGVPSLTLMENAGTACARFVLAKYPKVRRVTIFCGKGNNGGDGFVAARRLGDNGVRAAVILLADPAELRGDAVEMFKRLNSDPLIVRTADDLRSEAVQQALKAEVILDAILGTGFKPPVTGLYADAIRGMYVARTPIVAVDIPSGANADAFAPEQDALRARADHIVTFTAPRPAHVFAELTRGDTVIAPIGTPDEAIRSSLSLCLIAPHDFSAFLADREPDGHKGIYGHALVIGGSFGKAGAAAMAGISVLRSGAGLSTVAAPKSVLNTVAGFAPEIMTEYLAETEEGTIAPFAFEYGRVDAIVNGKHVIALGPGISRNPGTVQFVRAFVEKCATPLVIDADGLNAFQGCTEKLNGSKRPLVLTPHPGEMSRLTGLSTADIEKDRIGVAREFAAEHQCLLLLKGHRTLVASPDGTVWVNVTGNPGMASGGSGDVLTGVVTGMMAQAHSMPNDDRWARAVIAADYIHGLAGDVAREKIGEQSMIAGDLIEFLPDAFRRARQALATRTFTFHG